MQFNRFLALSIILTSMLCQPLAGSAQNTSSSETSNAKTIIFEPNQDWQKRRKQTFNTYEAAFGKGDQKAIADFDAILTSAEKNPVFFTPIENLDLFGMFYVPREGAKTAFTATVAQVTLAWYDALRFGSKSAQAEIVNNEMLFARPFVIAGNGAHKEMVDFLKQNPQQAKEMIETGIKYAGAVKENRTNQTWPTGYGMENMMCIMYPKEPCKAVEPMPEKEWPEAWEAAKNKVRSYYTIN